jgi:hypothetical protein
MNCESEKKIEKPRIFFYCRLKKKDENLAPNRGEKTKNIKTMIPK